eukprot:gene9425-biopygen10189
MLQRPGRRGGPPRDPPGLRAAAAREAHLPPATHVITAQPATPHCTSSYATPLCTALNHGSPPTRPPRPSTATLHSMPPQHPYKTSRNERGRVSVIVATPLLVAVDVLSVSRAAHWFPAPEIRTRLANAPRSSSPARERVGRRRCAAAGGRPRLRPLRAPARDQAALGSDSVAESVPHRVADAVTVGPDAEADGVGSVAVAERQGLRKDRGFQAGRRCRSDFLKELLKRSAQISGRFPSEQERNGAVTCVKNACGVYSMRVQRRSCPSQVHLPEDGIAHGVLWRSIFVDFKRDQKRARNGGLRGGAPCGEGAGGRAAATSFGALDAAVWTARRARRRPGTRRPARRVACPNRRRGPAPSRARAKRLLWLRGSMKRTIRPPRICTGGGRCGGPFAAGGEGVAAPPPAPPPGTCTTEGLQDGRGL